MISAFLLVAREHQHSPAGPLKCRFQEPLMQISRWLTLGAIDTDLRTRAGYPPQRPA